MYAEIGIALKTIRKKTQQFITERKNPNLNMGNESVWIWMNHVIWWVIKLVDKAALNKMQKWRNLRIWNPHFKNLLMFFLVK